MNFKKCFLTIATLSSAWSASLVHGAMPELGAKDLGERLEIRADIYAVDESKERVVMGPARTNYWRTQPGSSEIKGDWTSRFNKELIALRHRFTVLPDGRIQVSIEEYAKESGERSSPRFEQLIQKREYVLKHFEPVVWQVKNIKSMNVVVRYVPSIRELSKAMNVDGLPIAATGVAIYDNQGFMWANNIDFNGIYTGITSHRGTLVLSYKAFQGASEMGSVDGDQMTINLSRDLQVTLKAASAFLPAGMTGKVFAAFKPGKKSRGFNSVHTFDSSKEDKVLEELK
jgi:hypothetical protein